MKINKFKIFVCPFLSKYLTRKDINIMLTSPINRQTIGIQDHGLTDGLAILKIDDIFFAPHE